MSQWVFARHKIQPAGVINPEDFNEAILPYQRKAAGDIDGSNVSTSMQSSLVREDNFDFDLALRVARLELNVECPGSIEPGNELHIEESLGWIPVHTYSFSTVGGSLYFLWTFQMGMDTSNEIAHAQYGVQINGGEISELAVGDQDSYYAAYSMEVGVSGVSGGVELDGAIDLPPGNHTITVVARTIPIRSLLTSTATTYIYNSQLSLELAEA